MSREQVSSAADVLQRIYSPLSWNCRKRTPTLTSFQTQHHRPVLAHLFTIALVSLAVYIPAHFHSLCSLYLPVWPEDRWFSALSDQFVLGFLPCLLFDLSKQKFYLVCSWVMCLGSSLVFFWSHYSPVQDAVHIQRSSYDRSVVPNTL